LLIYYLKRQKTFLLIHEYVVKGLKNGKSLGIDGVINEYIKHRPYLCIICLYCLLHCIIWSRFGSFLCKLYVFLALWIFFLYSEHLFVYQGFESCLNIFLLFLLVNTSFPLVSNTKQNKQITNKAYNNYQFKLENERRTTSKTNSKEFWNILNSFLKKKSPNFVAGHHVVHFSSYRIKISLQKCDTSL
jgi:hypothetical protein